MKKPKSNKTLVVNLLAGPGAGKSTMAASIFSELKWKGIDCELATEFAKDLVWEERHKTFENQIYIFGKQHHRIFRLMGQVDVIITDSPLLLTSMYDREQRTSLRQLVFGEVNKCWNLNVFINRKKKYNPNGRNQTKRQAKAIDTRLKTFLNDNDVPYIQIEGTHQGVHDVVAAVIKQIKT